jgi:2'-5' RNA ligase
VRLFLAIPLPASALARLEAVLDGLRGRELKTVRAEGLHLTLVFLGERQEEEARAVGALLEAPELAVACIPASFGGYGQFPPRGSPRVIYTPVLRGARELIAFQQDLVGVLQRGGIRLEEEGRAFTPHLTLARRGGGPPDLRGLDALLDFEEPFTADRLVLYQSLLQPAGAEYRVLKSVPLRQG